jgi:uncharacterized SAM-binding protein YcdF (DUF218 family)
MIMHQFGGREKGRAGIPFYGLGGCHYIRVGAVRMYFRRRRPATAGPPAFGRYSWIVLAQGFETYLR